MTSVRSLLALASLLWPASGAVAGLRPIALSDGWPIQGFELNESGSVLFAGGNAAGFADGLVLVTSERMVRIASSGDAVPEAPGRAFLGFPAGKGVFALNGRDEAAFVAYHCPAGVGASECSRRGLERTGLYRYFGGRVERIADSGDPSPGGMGGYTTFSDLRINNGGSVAFSSLLERRTSAGVFIAPLEGETRQVLLETEPSVRFETLLFSDAGELLFTKFSNSSAGVYRYAGRLERLIGMGDRTVSGGALELVSDAAANARGEVIVSGAALGSTGLEVGLFVRDRTGRLTAFEHEGAVSDVQIDENGDLTYFAVSPAGSGIYRRVGGKTMRLVGSGDPVPGRPGERLDLEIDRYEVGRLSLSSAQVFVFRAGIQGKTGVRGLFVWIDGSLHALAITGDSAENAEESVLQEPTFKQFRVNRSGEVGFIAALCCGRFATGVFVGEPVQKLAIANPDFELGADWNQAVGWTASWSSSGSGEVIQHCAAADVFSGEHGLRLRVKGGGDAFVLSQAVYVISGAQYVVSTRLRYALPGASDGVFFTVIQYDAGGREIASHEFRGAWEDNRWRWELAVLPFRTVAGAATVRIRFGVVAASESILDVDAVR